MVAFRSASSQMNVAGTDQGSVTVTKPAGTAEGDVLLAFTNMGDNDTGFSAPAGFVKVGEFDDTGQKSHLYKKIATDSEPANYTWTLSTAQLGTIGVAMVAFSGAHDLGTWAARAATTEDPVLINELYTNRDALPFHFYCWRDSTTGTVSATGFTEAFDSVSNNNGATIFRGQAGYYPSAIVQAGDNLTEISINPTTSITSSVVWSVMVQDAAPDDETWDSTNGDFGVEIELNGTWTEITPYVQHQDKIRITRGVQGTTERADYSRAYFTLENTDGRFSLWNTGSPYYPYLTRNTPVRIHKAYGTKQLQLDGAMEIPGDQIMVGSNITTPLVDDLAVTGDIDVRIDLEPETWRQEQLLAGIGQSSFSSGWYWYLTNEGLMVVVYNSSTLSFSAVSTTAVPTTTARQALRFTLDVNNGASGSTVTFYTSDSISGSWTQLGDAVVNTGAISLFYDGGIMGVGHLPYSGVDALHAIVYHFEYRNGIAGTLVSDIDFTALTNGAKTFTDDDSHLWIMVNNAVVSNRRWRFYGEIPEWPNAWDSTGSWIYVNSVAAGVQRRLERSTSDPSAWYRHYTKSVAASPTATVPYVDPLAYWPCEDGDRSFECASAIPSVPPMYVYGAPDFAGYDFIPGSKPIPRLASAKFQGRVNNAESGYFMLRFILHAETSIAAGSNIFTVWGGSGIQLVKVNYTGVDTWQLQMFATEAAVETDTATTTVGSISVETIGKTNHVIFVMEQNGSDIDWSLDVWSDRSEASGATGASFAGQTLGKIRQVAFNNDSTNKMSTVGIGHVAVFGSTGQPTLLGLDRPEMGFRYETAANRIRKFTQEERLEPRHVGARDKSMFMGVQDADAVYSNMTSAAFSDQGFLIDPLDALGTLYRTLRSMFNQPPHITLSYTGNELSGELTPVQDDSYINNDVTVNRGDAGSSRFKLESGALSVLPPPNGVGEYSQSVSMSLAHDGLCEQIASWMVHEGTLDELHFRQIDVALENLRIAADATLIEKLLRLDIGKRLDITDTPDFLPPEDVRQIVIGYEEWFDNFQHDFRLNTVPERTFEVATYDDGDRFDTAGSTLATSVNTVATSLSVSTELGPVWSTTAADFDIRIDGERMTVTAVANDTTTDTSDTFNRADSTTNLGSTDGGVVQAWTQNSGTWGINTNAAYISAAAAASIATVAGDNDFELCSVTVSSWASGEAFLVFRHTDASNYIRWGGTVGSAATLIVRDAAVETTYTADDTFFTLAAGDTLAVRCQGSVIECFVNGALALTVSNTAEQSATRVGMRLATTAPRLDNFSLDVAHSAQTLTVTRSVNGVVSSHAAGQDVVLWDRPTRGL